MHDAKRDFRPDVETAGQSLAGGLLLRSKISIPPVSDHHVSRPRFRDRLDPDNMPALTVVVSPAGYGKTAFLVEWASNTTSRVSWLRLDESDDDPGVFVRYLVASVASAVPEAAEPANQRAEQGASPRAIAAALIDGVAESGEPIVTTLDDFHRVSSDPVIELCASLLDALPESWRWIIGSRSEPALGLARRRANLALRTISVEQLRFDDEEAYRLMTEGLGIDVSPEVASVVNEHAAGWAAGLCLAGLAAQESRTDREGTLLRYSSHDRHLGAYFAEEVFAQLPSRLREFLLDTSVLHILTPESCTAVTGAEDAVQLLNQVSGRRLFITRVDKERPDVFEYHDLFSEWLLAELQHRVPGRSSLLRRRAAAWCAERGYFAQAIRYALDAADWDTAADLIHGHGYRLLQRGLFRTMLTWIAALPESEIRHAPALAVLAGDAAVQIGEWSKVAHSLEIALGVDSSTIAGQAVRAGGLQLQWFTLLAGGTLEEMWACSREMEQLAETVAVARPHHLGEDQGRALGLAATTRYITGEYSKALELVRRAGRSPATLFATLLPEGIEALVRFVMGDTAASDHLARKSLSWLDRFDQPPIGALLGALALLWTGDDDDVSRSVAIVKQVAEQTRLPQGATFVALCNAEMAHRAGDHRQAAQHVEAARQEMNGLREPRFVQKLVEVQAERVPSSSRTLDIDAISDREREVLRLLQTDLTRRQIARELGISPETVKTHSSSIYRKLGVSSRSEAVAGARRFGLI